MSRSERCDDQHPYYNRKTHIIQGVRRKNFYSSLPYSSSDTDKDLTLESVLIRKLRFIRLLCPDFHISLSFGSGSLSVITYDFHNQKLIDLLPIGIIHQSALLCLFVLTLFFMASKILLYTLIIVPTAIAAMMLPSRTPSSFPRNIRHISADTTM